MELSVALCTFNGEHYIVEQLFSIANQLLPIDEIIVCDDCSTDNTIPIVKAFADSHHEISFSIHVNQSNLGVTKNFEKAISLCTGDIIFLSDQDDIWREDKTLKICQYFENNPTKKIVFTDATLIDANGNTISNKSLLDAVNLLPNLRLWENGLDFEILNIDNRVTGATMAFRSSLKKNLLPFDIQKDILHDYQLSMYGCLFGCLGLITERLIFYRQHDNNVIGINSNNWIYQKKKATSLITNVVEPIPPRTFINRYNNSKRFIFYKSRVKYYSNILGKFKLLLLLPKYVFYYHNYWALLYFSDLLYGISSKLRSRLIRRFCGRE